MKKSIAAALVAGALTLVPAAAASAHTPNITASCSGVVVTGTSYDRSQGNTWFVVIDGVEKSGVFGAELNIVVPVPQGGKTSTWAAQVSDAAQTPGYTKSSNGAVGPCGEKPPAKPADIVTPTLSESPDCEAHVVTVTKGTLTTHTELVNNKWVALDPIPAVTETTTRTASEQECPLPVVAPAEPSPNPIVNYPPADQTPQVPAIVAAPVANTTPHTALAATGLDGGQWFTLWAGVGIAGLGGLALYVNDARRKASR